MKKEHIGLIVLGVLLLASVGNLNRCALNNTAPVENKVETKKYSDPEFESGFMEGCVGDKVDTKDFCKCSHDFLVEKYGVVKLIKLSSDDTAPEYKKLINEAVANCFYLYPME